MKVNYNVDHKMFALDVFKECKSAGDRMATWLVLSQVVHWTKHSKGKSCELWKGQLSEDTGLHMRLFAKATKQLIKHRLIKEIKPYDRKTQSPAVYIMDIGYIHQMQKLYPPRSKAISTMALVNNYDNNYKDHDEIADASRANEKNLTDLSIEERKRLQEEKEEQRAYKRMQQNKVKK